MSDTDWNIVYTGNLFAIEKHIVKGYERAVRPPGVRLILKDKNQGILITREYRGEQGGFDFRLPGGKVFDDLRSYLQVRGDEEELQKSILEAARIEAKEEAGVDEIENLKIIDISFAGASVEWTLYYLTGDIVSISEQQLMGDELIHGIEVGFYSEQEVLKMIQEGGMKEDRSIAMLTRYLQNR